MKNSVAPFLAALALASAPAQEGGKALPASAVPSLPTSATAPSSPSLPLSTSDLVKTYRNSLVFVSGTNGAGSGFIARLGGVNFLVTNAHVAAGVRGAGFRALDGTQMQIGAASAAVGHDIFRMQLAAAAAPFTAMNGVDEGTSIGDAVVVLGNAEGAGVINTITGKLVGVGPQLVEVDAPFQPGNSGSPIIHLKSGKVIGVATYLTIRKFDPATNQPVKEPVVRRFGYRLDSVKTWQPVNWPAFFAQATEMQGIETLTDDLVKFLDDLADGHGVDRGRHTNPVIKNRIDAWLEARSRRMSPRDTISTNQNFLSFLKVTCQSDLTAARPRLTYDYFQRGLETQQKERSSIAEVFDKIIKEIQKAQ